MVQEGLHLDVWWARNGNKTEWTWKRSGSVAHLDRWYCSYDLEREVANSWFECNVRRGDYKVIGVEIYTLRGKLGNRSIVLDWVYNEQEVGFMISQILIGCPTPPEGL